MNPESIKEYINSITVKDVASAVIVNWIFTLYLLIIVNWILTLYLLIKVS